MKKTILTIIILIIIAGVFYFVKLKDLNEKSILVDGTTDSIENKKIENNYIKIDNNNAVVLANNAFAFDAYSKLVEKGKNTFFSPLSVSSAFAVVYEGANDKTANEIQSVFHFPKDINFLRDSFSSINNETNKVNDDYQISIANALWVQKDYRFLNEYLSTVDKYYNAKATNVDFKNATEETRQTINKWVEDKTNEKIKDLIPSGYLDTTTKITLTDAIYFNGKWIKPFDKKETKENEFFLNPKNSVKVHMMQQNNSESVFNYAENNDLQILEMPYKGYQLSMIVLLPKKNDLISFEKLFTLSSFNSWKKELKIQRVNVFIPQFKFNAKYFMTDILKSMGMPTAFSGDADFSKMDGARDLFISDVIHQAFIDVNEEGTEAVAATTVAINGGIFLQTNPIPIFRADHPFIFLIQDTNSGNILFLGRVVDPNIKN
jgi:serpin B